MAALYCLDPKPRKPVLGAEGPEEQEAPLIPTSSHLFSTRPRIYLPLKTFSKVKKDFSGLCTPIL